MSKFIRDWDELRQIPNKSETHILEVGEYSTWLKAKNRKKYDDTRDWFEQLPNLSTYLSTHTFYGDKYEFSTRVLQICGFDVELAN